MKVFVVYEDMDNGCDDPECCGGPNPQPSIAVFDSIDEALKHGIRADDLVEVSVNTNKFVRIM